MNNHELNSFLLENINDNYKRTICDIKNYNYYSSEIFIKIIKALCVWYKMPYNILDSKKCKVISKEKNGLLITINDKYQIIQHDIVNNGYLSYFNSSKKLFFISDNFIYIIDDLDIEAKYFSQFNISKDLHLFFCQLNVNKNIPSYSNSNDEIDRILVFMTYLKGEPYDELDEKKNLFGYDIKYIGHNKNAIFLKMPTCIYCLYEYGVSENLTNRDILDHLNKINFKLTVFNVLIEGAKCEIVDLFYAKNTKTYILLKHHLNV